MYLNTILEYISSFSSMHHNHALLSALLLLSPLVIFFLWSKHRAYAMADDPSKDTALISTACMIVRALQNNDYKSLQTYFAYLLRPIAWPSFLKYVFLKIFGVFGPIHDFQKPVITSRGIIFTRLKCIVHFQRLTMVLVFNMLTSSGRITKISIETPMNSGLLRPWEEPSYSDLSSFEDVPVKIRYSYLWPRLRAMLSIPATQPPAAGFPAIVLLGGSGDADMDLSVGANKSFKDLSHGLATNEVVVLRMDKPTMMIVLKTLVMRNITVEDEYVRPALAALATLVKHSAVDANRIYICGLSLGGRVAGRVAMAAIENEICDVAGVISLAGNSGDLTTAIVRQSEYLQKILPVPEGDYEELLETNRFNQQQLARDDFDSKSELRGLLKYGLSRYLWDLKVNDPVSTAQVYLRKPGKRMLLCQGRNDWQVTIDYDLRIWQDGLKEFLGADEKGNKKSCPKAEVKIYDSVNHCMLPSEHMEKGMREYDEPTHVDFRIIEDIANWICVES